MQKIGTRTWRVKEALVYRSTLLNAEITVSAGEETDLPACRAASGTFFLPMGPYAGSSGP